MSSSDPSQPRGSRHSAEAARLQLPGLADHDLSDRHLRVLGYLGLYLDRRGHLPTHAELAEACRLRSTSTAHGVVRDLERFGLLIRDAPQSRLARLDARVSARPEVDDGELWVLLRALELQSTCELRWARDGLSLTGDLGLLDWVLQRAQQHLARLRAYEHVRVLLHEPTADTIQRLEQMESVMSTAARAYVPLKSELRTWFTYSAMGNLATRRISQNIYANPALTAMHLALDLDDDTANRADWRYCARALSDGDHTVEAAAKEIVDISDEATRQMRDLMADDLEDIIPVQAVTVEDLVVLMPSPRA